MTFNKELLNQARLYSQNFSLRTLQEIGEEKIQEHMKNILNDIASVLTSNYGEKAKIILSALRKIGQETLENIVEGGNFSENIDRFCLFNGFILNIVFFEKNNFLCELKKNDLGDVYLKDCIIILLVTSILEIGKQKNINIENLDKDFIHELIRTIPEAEQLFWRYSGLISLISDETLKTSYDRDMQLYCQIVSPVSRFEEFYRAYIVHDCEQKNKHMNQHTELFNAWGIINDSKHRRGEAGRKKAQNNEAHKNKVIEEYQNLCAKNPKITPMAAGKEIAEINLSSPTTITDYNKADTYAKWIREWIKLSKNNIN